MSRSLGLYRLVTRLAEPFAPALLARRARRGKEDAARIGERLGRACAPRPDGPLVWLHGASVGESLSILPLVERLRTERPHIGLLVTSGTVTSAALLAERLPAGAVHQYVPIDAPGAVARFLGHWRPDLVVFAESELWPNLLLGAKARGARLALVSARITEASAEGWGKALGAAQALMTAFDLVMPQDQASAQRLRALGAKVDGLVNLKFVGAPLPFDDAERGALAKAIGKRQVVLAASTHPGEEETIAKAVRALPGEPLLIVVPRHPERGPAIAAALGAARRAAGEPVRADTAIYVADTLGEMGLFYALADLAVMGGSFAEGIGGHNPLEPARAGAPIVSGPHAFNFTEVYSEMSEAGAALIDPKLETLAPLLVDAARRKAMAEAAGAYAASRAAALDDAWAALTPLLPA